jgi:hypothetical protein
LDLSYPCPSALLSLKFFAACANYSALNFSSPMILPVMILPFHPLRSLRFLLLNQCSSLVAAPLPRVHLWFHLFAFSCALSVLRVSALD